MSSLRSSSKLAPFVVLLAAGLFSSAAAQDEKLKIPDPKPVSVTTRDGVVIMCKYYPGGVFRKGADGELEERDGKEVMPLILVHSMEEQGSVYYDLAERLQALGHAVIVPDLRGHGESTVTRAGIKLDASKMKPRDFASVVLDIDAVKKFLLAENNEKKVNIELLTIVASEMGASAAIQWSIKDWSLKQLVGYKQGRDVKSLILLSPRMNYSGLTIRDLIKHPLIREKMLMMVAYGGQNSSVRKDVNLLEKQIERYRQADPASLRLMPFNTTLQGTKLLDPRSPVPEQIIKFIDEQVFAKASQFPWTDRTGPLEDADQ